MLCLFLYIDVHCRDLEFNQNVEDKNFAKCIQKLNFWV